MTIENNSRVRTITKPYPCREFRIQRTGVKLFWGLQKHNNRENWEVLHQMLVAQRMKEQAIESLEAVYTQQAVCFSSMTTRILQRFWISVTLTILYRRRVWRLRLALSRSALRYCLMNTYSFDGGITSTTPGIDSRRRRWRVQKELNWHVYPKENVKITQIDGVQPETLSIIKKRNVQAWED